MLATLLATVIGVPTPSPTTSPLPAAVVQWYALRGADSSGLDPALVRAVIDAESGGDPKAVSKAGAIGMMQLQPETASDCGIHDLYDPMQNVECGARTLGYLVRRYGVQTGIAAYNFGAGSVESVGNHFTKMPVETQQYVKSVIDEYDALQHYSLDAASPTPSPSPTPESVSTFDAALHSSDPVCTPLAQAYTFVPYVGEYLVIDEIQTRPANSAHCESPSAAAIGEAAIIKTLQTPT